MVQNTEWHSPTVRIEVDSVTARTTIDSGLV